MAATFVPSMLRVLLVILATPQALESELDATMFVKPEQKPWYMHTSDRKELSEQLSKVGDDFPRRLAEGTPGNDTVCPDDPEVELCDILPDFCPDDADVDLCDILPDRCPDNADVDLCDVVPDVCPLDADDDLCDGETGCPDDADVDLCDVVPGVCPDDADVDLCDGVLSCFDDGDVDLCDIVPSGCPDDADVDLCDGDFAVPTPEQTAVPTPVPTLGPTESVPPEKTVVVSMTLKNVDYDKLVADEAMTARFKDVIKEAVTDVAGGMVGPEHISVKLEVGSVKVTATITPPKEVVLLDLQAIMSTNGVMIGAAVQNGLSLLPNIDDVTTGVVFAMGVSVFIPEKVTVRTGGDDCKWDLVGYGMCHEGGLEEQEKFHIEPYAPGGLQDAKDACCQSDFCDGFQLDIRKPASVMLYTMGKPNGAEGRRYQCWKRTYPEAEEYVGAARRPAAPGAWQLCWPALALLPLLARA